VLYGRERCWTALAVGLLRLTLVRLALLPKSPSPLEKFSKFQ